MGRSGGEGPGSFLSPFTAFAPHQDAFTGHVTTEGSWRLDCEHRAPIDTPLCQGPAGCPRALVSRSVPPWVPRKTWTAATRLLCTCSAHALLEGVLPKNRVQEREETLTPFYSHILPQGLGDLGLPWQLSGKEPTG